MMRKSKLVNLMKNKKIYSVSKINLYFNVFVIVHTLKYSIVVTYLIHPAAWQS